MLLAVLLLISLLILLPCCHSAKLCLDHTYPKMTNGSLAFCGYIGLACCSTADDLAIEDRFTKMNISGTACGDVIKSILCAQCNPYAFDLYSKSNNFPILCNNNNLVSSLPPTNFTTDFCTEAWNTCKDVAIPNSPFTISGTSSNKLSDSYKGASEFCSAAGGSATEHTVCFNGGISVGFSAAEPGTPPQGICLEKILSGSFMYTNFAPHPDGSNRVFLATQSGKIFLATVPPQGSGKILDINLKNPFIDLTDLVHYYNDFGLMGFAFHPNFATNGRFFVSYNCDKSKSSNCYGKCSCNSEINCDISKLRTSYGPPCQYHVVVAEYTVNGTASSPNMASNADPAEVLRVVTIGLPDSNRHAGQIYFGPTDGYLYLMMSDGINGGDPWNFAQNKKSMLGKTLRLNVDVMPTQADIDNLSLWGNYSIPKDNPYFTDPTFRPEVYTYGHRNPWRCSYDAERPAYLFCGETSTEGTYEEINLLSKGGNYRWRIYQGYDLYSPSWSPGLNISANSIDPIFPVMGYNRSEVNDNLGFAAIISGYLYRGNADPCLYGRFIFGDLYANDMFTAAETPPGSRNFFSRQRITFTCTRNSPIPCDFTSRSALPSIGYIFSFGQDNSKDLYILTSKGVYRVVRLSLCGYSCPLEDDILLSATPPPSSSSPGASSGL